MVQARQCKKYIIHEVRVATWRGRFEMLVLFVLVKNGRKYNFKFKYRYKYKDIQVLVYEQARYNFDIFDHKR